MIIPDRGDDPLFSVRKEDEFAPGSGRSGMAVPEKSPEEPILKGKEDAGLIAG